MEKKRLQIIRVISVTLFFLLLNAVGIKKTLAQSFSMDGLSYTVNSDSVSVTLNGLAQGVTASGSLDIPEMVSYEGTGYSVTIIGEYAFYNKSGFTGRLTIPATITSIGTYAFYNCSGFVEVHFNATNCSDTYDSPFHNCGGTLVIGDNVIRIPAQMFYNSGFTGNLIIPDAVTSIGDYAFEDCSGFTGILTIPNAVSNIGRGAFSGCSGFSGVVYNAINCENASYNNPPFQGCGGSLVIGDNVERIPSYIFRNCSGFSGSLTIGNSVTFIGENAFSYCSGFIGSLSIPNSVTTIGYSAFSNCTGFTGNLTIGDSVTTIGHYAFSNCSGFTGSLSLGESVTTIGVNAFSNCSGFTGNLTIPSSVTTIGSYAFNNCSNFTEIQYNPKNCTVETDALHPSNINPVFPGCLGTLIIGNNVESIGGGMFKDGEFSEVIFNATNCADVSASIGNYPFTNCSSTLTIGDNVERIPAYMFTDCSGFTGSLTIPESVTSIGVIAFRNCTGITEVFFNAINCADVSAYNGNYPFKNCGGTLTIGNNVERIPAYIFSNCEGFTGNLIIPNSVISIGNYAFYNCNGFEENLTIGNSVTTIGAYAFAGCNGISEVLYNAVNCADVNNSPFSNFIGELTIGENVERIPANMFKNCNGFTGGLTIPNSVTTIGNYAFSGCSGFSGNLTIGNFVTLIGSNAFSDCNGFTGCLTIPNSISSIGYSAFRNCSGFSGVVFNATNCADYNYYSNSPFRGCSGTLAIGENVDRIPAYMFYNCSGFTGDLTIPSSVTSIGSGAFSGCSGFIGLQYNATNCADVSSSSYPFYGFSGTLTIGENVERIPANMFRESSGFIGGLTISNSVTSIGGYAFCNSGFTDNLTIPNNVTSIGKRAFYNCGFVDVVFNATNCADVSASYSNDSPFYDCNGTLTIGDNVERIPAYMFYNCSGFTGNLTIPNSVVTIGGVAFSGCNGFTGELTIPYSVTSIGSSAFSGCSGFTGSLTIPNSVTTIGLSAFYNCSGITDVIYNATNCANVDDPYYSHSPFQNCGSTLAIGGNVDRIPAYMFYNCSNFAGCLTIPNSVTSIGSSAFSGCSGFTDVLTIPNSMTSIGSSAFYGCSGFTGSLTIPSSVTSIGLSAFYNCNGITDVVYNATNCANVDDPYYSHSPFQSCGSTLAIGGTVERIPANMFYNCSDFTSMNCFLETPPSVGTNAFYNVNNEIPITVPCGTINAYQNASGWNQFTNYQQDCSATIISDEICQGEDYLQNGFEIIQPEVGEGDYTITLPSSQGLDSIVNLTLTVYPTYFFTEDTTLCNATSFQWHGNIYTESGLYYDSLQTIHGCDSIYALSLEFFNTPLGEFTYMNPTNNYPFSSLPITFSWDAVSGAEYYNLYLWNTNDSVPSMPFAGNIYNRSCYVSSLQNHQTYNWYVEAVNTCFSSTSSVRSFTLNIPPTMHASTGSLNFGEVALNNSHTLTLYVSGNALDDAITLQITGEDASMFSFEQGSNWNGLTGGSLTVTFSPTAVQYNYTANLVITTGTLTQMVQLTGSLADMFVFNTFVTQDVFEMNSTIPIYGTVTDVNNSPMAGAEVEVKVKVMGTTRSLFATTGDDGHFSVDFVPAYSESGYYTVNSGRVGHSSTAVHDDFNIPGMNLVTNGWILWDVVQNETTTGSVVIRNRSQIPLTNIQVTATNLPEGCSFTFQPLSLQGMEEGVLEYSVTGSALTSGNNYEEVRLVATSAEGATMNFSAWYYCAEPRGILYAAPNNITTTMTKGNSKIVDVMLYNNGTGPTGDVYLDLPSVDWLSVVGNDTLPSIAVHDSAYFSLRLSANENTPLVQYTGNIAVNCERGDGLSLPYSITAVSDSTGTLVVDVTDDYTYNGNGQHLAGATVTVKGYYSLQTVAIGLTGSDGTFTVEDIPEGYYRMSITAPRHAEYQATIQIEGSQTNTQNIYLQYQAITYSWNVVPTEIEDEYTFELVVDYETNVPVPVVVIDMPQTFPELEEGESYVFDYIITNYGLVDTYDATLYPPTGHPLYDFTPLITEIDTLHAQSSVVIPCTMTVRTGQRSPLVYAALNGRGERDDDCPDYVKTEVQGYYYCRGEKIPTTYYCWRQVGTHPCSTPPSSGGNSGPGGHSGGGSGGGGSHYNGSGGSSTPPVTTQQQGCNDDPCQTDAMDELNSCPPQFDNTPKLPPVQPGNNR